MNVQQLAEDVYRFQPAPMDVHAHPRVFDSVSDDNFVDDNQQHEGKAGLRAYTT